MFHPDNIKNYHPKGNKVCVSVYDLWHTHGGSKGLAQKLRTDLKVINTFNLTCVLNISNRKVYTVLTQISNQESASK